MILSAIMSGKLDMNMACSVVLVCSPFAVSFKGETLRLEKGNALLVRGGLELLSPFSGCFRGVSFSELTISRYLLLRMEEREINYFQKTPQFLYMNVSGSEVANILIDTLSQEKAHSVCLMEMLSLSCLAVFSSESMFSSFLMGCVNGISSRVSLMFHTDIAANWTLREVSSQLCMSESLLKKRLKEEGTCFSELLLAERMKTASVLLRKHSDSVGIIAAKCGYSNASYFICVFRRYFGVTPAGYRISPEHCIFSKGNLSV